MDESWLADRAREFVSLRGRRVDSWIGVEFALREDVPGVGPQFHDPQVPCLQLWGLQAVLDGSLFSIGTYQRDCAWGLWQHQWDEFEGKLQDAGRWDENRGTRWRSLSELPTGQIGEVTVRTDSADSVLAEVLLVACRG